MKTTTRLITAAALALTGAATAAGTAQAIDAPLAPVQQLAADPAVQETLSTATSALPGLPVNSSVLPLG